MKPAIAKVSKTINITFFSLLQGLISLLLVKIQVRRNNLKTMSENEDSIVVPWLRTVLKTVHSWKKC